jgi:hypothetical protein
LKSPFWKRLFLVVLFSGLFPETYFVYFSGGFEDFITHLTMAFWLRMALNCVVQR